MSQIRQENVRNFCIIAHIDHGKSTLGCLIEATGAFQRVKCKIKSWIIWTWKRAWYNHKAQAIRMEYQHSDGETYI